MPEQQLTAPVNETQMSPVEEMNHCHDSADLVMVAGCETLDQYAMIISLCAGTAADCPSE